MDRIQEALERLADAECEVELTVETVVGRQLKRQRGDLDGSPVEQLAALLERLADQVERADT